jgi:hypothetical protein
LEPNSVLGKKLTCVGLALSWVIESGWDRVRWPVGQAGPCRGEGKGLADLGDELGFWPKAKLERGKHFYFPIIL